MPRPPSITNAPVLGEIAFDVDKTLSVSPTYSAPPMPTPPTTFNAPVLVLVAEVVEVKSTRPVATILVPLMSPPTFKFLPIPAPPATVNAPVFVVVD